MVLVKNGHSDGSTDSSLACNKASLSCNNLNCCWAASESASATSGKNAIDDSSSKKDTKYLFMVFY
jgi:hypothetical protein